MSAPDKIWANVSVIGDGEALAGEWTYRDVGLTEDTEYTRSDLIPALIAEAVAREKEECAKIAEECQRQSARRSMGDKYYRGMEAGAQAIAAAIRARGQD
jgi:hypothetical protein